MATIQEAVGIAIQETFERFNPCSISDVNAHKPINYSASVIVKVYARGVERTPRMKFAPGDEIWKQWIFWEGCQDPRGLIASIDRQLTYLIGPSNETTLERNRVYYSIISDGGLISTRHSAGNLLHRYKDVLYEVVDKHTFRRSVAHASREAAERELSRLTERGREDSRFEIEEIDIYARFAV